MRDCDKTHILIGLFVPSHRNHQYLNRSGSSPRGITSSPKNKSDLIESRRSKQVKYSTFAGFRIFNQFFTLKQDSERENTIQERLEVVWRKLKIPDSQKLDLALKYSGDEHIYRLPEV